MEFNNKAFTLLEILVVVLIIGILAAIAVPRYQKAVAKSKFTQLKLATHAIVNAEEIYFLANGKYATNLGDLDISFPQARLSNMAATGDRLIFDWGFCALTSHLNWPECFLNNPRISYWYYLPTKQISCFADTESQIAIDICRQETGKKSGTLTQTYCLYPCYWFKK